MGDEQAFDLSVKANLECLKKVRQYISQTATRLGVNNEALGDLLLVVDEAVTNVVIHGYGDDEGQVEVQMQADGDAVSIQIRDRAETFDNSHVNAPQLDTELKDRPFGGMGIFLIRKMTDEAEFMARPGGGNEIHLLKRDAITR